MAIELDEGAFDGSVLKAAKPVLVDFYASWCGPCAQQTPVLEKWAEGNANAVEVFKVNVDIAPALASKYGVMSIPTLLLFSGSGKERARAVGLQNDKGLDALLAKGLLASDRIALIVLRQ